MKCPVCVKEGLRSKVYGGIGLSTLVYYEPFYDEDGEYHDHDGNAFTADYSCSYGHEFTVTSYKKCWCGWSGGEDSVTVTKAAGITQLADSFGLEP